MKRRWAAGMIVFAVLAALCSVQCYRCFCEGDGENLFFQALLILLCIIMMGKATITVYKKEKTSKEGRL